MVAEAARETTAVSCLNYPVEHLGKFLRHTDLAVFIYTGLIRSALYFAPRTVLSIKTFEGAHNFFSRSRVNTCLRFPKQRGNHIVIRAAEGQYRRPAARYSKTLPG